MSSCSPSPASTSASWTSSSTVPGVQSPSSPKESRDCALLARLDDFELDSHVDWLVDAMLDAARSDSLKRACQAFGLKREREMKTAYGQEKESWRDRLARAATDGELTRTRVFLQVLTQEQGWRYRPAGTEQPSLRERLIVEFAIDEKAVEQKVRSDFT